MINWTRIDELKTDLGEEDFEEIVGFFLEEVAEKLSIMANGTSTNLSEDAHFLKGSSANLGFTDMQALCETTEKNPDPAMVPQILSCFEASKAAFLSPPG